MWHVSFMWSFSKCMFLILVEEKFQPEMYQGYGGRNFAAPRAADITFIAWSHPSSCASNR